MNSKYIFQIKKDNSIERVNLEDFEKIFEIKYLPFLKIEDQKLLKKIDKMCVNAGRNGDLTKENIWFGHFYERELKEHFISDVYVKWINEIKEYGLFANKDFKNLSYIGEYTGCVRKYIKKIDDRNPYCFEYSIGYKKTKYTIDAREEGSVIRFVNHSYEPNVTPINVYSDGKMHLVFRTNRKVLKDEELTYDYGPFYWSRRERPE